MHTQILVGSRADPQSILHSVRRQIASVNPDQQANGHVDDLEAWIRREPEWARGRLVSILFGAFSVLALLLAAVGLYSVVSYSVVQRTNEFGIRIALGARKKDVLRIVLASAGVSVGSGLLGGAGAQLWTKPADLPLGGERRTRSNVDSGCFRCDSCRRRAGLPDPILESVVGRSHDGTSL